MATVHAEVAYSYRRYRPVITTVNDSNRTLSIIEQLLVDAGDAYRARRYQGAVDLYQRARTILWAQIQPTIDLDEKIAWGVDLRRSLASYSAEWMNLLPVEQASVGARPRETVALDDVPRLGLVSSNIDAKGISAAADLEVADALKARGNEASARFFHDRAVQLAPDVVKGIESAANGTTVPGGAVPAVAAGTGAAGAGAAGAAAPIAGAPGRGGAGEALAAGGAAIGGAAGAGLAAGVAPIRAGTFQNLADAPLTLGNTALALNRVSPSTQSVATSARLFQLGNLASAVIADPVAVELPPQITVAERSYSVKVGDAVQKMAWNVGDAVSVDQMLSTVYDARRALTVLPDVLIRPSHAADVAVGITHAWYYETPLGLAECFHAMGSWAAAEEWYLRAAGYAYLNAAIEAPYLWSRLASLYLDWGDSLFRDDDAAGALPVYEKLLKSDNTAPDAPLYSLPGLAPGADAARNVIANFATPEAITASPSISAVIFDVQAQLAKIAGGLDFWGHWAQNVPIWTFDYLQSVAANFCQLAIGAERDAMTFWEKADSGELTRLQLTQNIAQSKAERDAAAAQVTAAQQEVGVYDIALQLAQQRAADARANAAEYASKSAAWSMHQALSAQLSGGEDGKASQLNQLADRMIQGGYSISGDRGTLAAAEQLTAARLQNQYEIDRMNREAGELDIAAAQATAERATAQARAVAAQASAHAADVRVAGAQELLAAFDQQRFTPDVWHALGDRMGQISNRYLLMALDVAKRMQRAYNFENDVLRAVIKPDYSADAVRGMLAADALMADVQSFSYDLVTSVTAKAQPVRQTVSLAQRYPFLFETQLRATGRMQFQTNLDDFDSVYPGTYAGRIEHVEIAIDGIVPARGISGTLTNAGLSQYRMPSPWPAGSSGIKHRVQSRETLVISDYDLRSDAIVVDTDRRQRRVFEGAGLASSWTLDLPKDVNALDYQALVDVRLTFTYEARFDPGLRDTVLADLASRPQAHQRSRPLPLRWIFPDAFFAFYGSGALAFSLDRNDFSGTETDPRLAELSLVVVTTPLARSGGIKLKVSAPGKDAVTVTTAADGTVAVADLAALAAGGGSALGAYRIELATADNPGWVTDGRLDLGAIDNIALVLSYTFTPRA